MSEDFTNVSETAELPNGELPEGDLASLLGVSDAVEEWFPVPEWGFKIKLRSLSKADQIRCRKMATRQGRLDDQAFEGLLLLAGIAQPKLGPEHLDRLQSKNVGVVNKIQRRILELSSMMEADSEEADADFQE
jgi:hypothetical protein